MESKQLAEIRKWFACYVQSFARGGERIHPLLQIKVEHSERVAEEARSLASDLHWSTSKQNFAEALGILHDIGRFPQFAEYGTFSDAASVDHGEYGWSVAVQAPVLFSLSSTERRQILDGIRYHNSKTIPDDLPQDNLSFLKLIRDADKLDIFHVVLEAVETDGFCNLPDMLPHISLDRSCSLKLVQEIQNHVVCSLENLTSLGDFLVMQLSWVYDLNYHPTLERLCDRRIVSRILRQLPRNSAVHNLGEAVNGFIADHLRIT